MDLETLRYPIGRFRLPTTRDAAFVETCIADIAACPAHIKAAVANLTDEQLDTPYRPEGWTIRQVVHHVADSHINSYMRFKWTLTEDVPIIKTYNEKDWAKEPEALTGPVELSLNLLEALHARWHVILKNLTPAQLKRKLYHPEMKRHLDLTTMVALYAWHGKHHTAHITSLRKRKEW